MSLQPVQDIERQQPDLALAYAQLAPLVTEAHAYYDAGRLDKCEAALRMARGLIEQVSNPAVIVTFPQPECQTATWQHSPPKFKVGQTVLVGGWHAKAGQTGVVDSIQVAPGKYNVTVDGDVWSVREVHLSPVEAAPKFEIGSRVRIINRAHSLFGCFGHIRHSLGGAFLGSYSVSLIANGLTYSIAESDLEAVE